MKQVSNENAIINNDDEAQAWSNEYLGNASGTLDDVYNETWNSDHSLAAGKNNLIIYLNYWKRKTKYDSDTATNPK